MANRSPAPLRVTGTVLRALLGLSLLATLVVGAPYLLLTVGHQPTELSGGTELLTQQDDGSLFLVVLTCIGWAAWAAFAFSVLVELVAILRRRSAPRIRGLGGMQSLASFLIGGIVLLAPTAASAATVAPAVAATVSHTAGQGAQATSETAAPQTTATTGALRHTVTSATESPWELAQTYLGSGPRWRDIAALNPDVPELVAGDQYLPEGVVLTLPSDARLPTTTDTASTSEAPKQTETTVRAQGNEERQATASYTVRPGNYLSKIAETELGDGDRWPELYEANKGSEQPYGHTFTDPDRIYPGQELALPGTVQPGARTDPDRSTPPRTGQQNVPESSEDQAAPEMEHDQGAKPKAQQPERQGELGAGVAGAQTTEPTRSAPNGSAAAAPGPSRLAAPEADATASAPAPAESTTASSGDQEQERSSADTRAGVIGLGATGFLAAALVGSLAYRRMMQQRRRRRDHRIAMPSGRSARTEQALRSVDAGVELALLSDALRTVALHLAQEGRPLPEITAVQLGARGVRVHLAEAVAPVAPFTAAPEQHAVWWCPAGSRELLPAEELRDVDPPYPVLVALGEDEEGAIVLVDLEHVGALHLTGRGRVAFLRTLALSLALTPLAEQIEIAVAGEDTAPGLSMLDGNRVIPCADLGGAVRLLEQHQAGQQRVLEEFGKEGALSRGRASGDVVEELWPLVVLADLDTCPGSAESQGRLWQALDVPVRSAMAIVTSSTVAPEAGAVWCVDTDAGEVTVPGSEVRVKLVSVSEEEYVDVLEVGLVADSPTDHPVQPPVPQPSAPRDGYEATEPPSAPPLHEKSGAEGVRGPALMAGFADLDDEPDDRPGDAETGEPALPAVGQRAAAAAPGDVVLTALSPTAKVGVRLPQPADAGAPISAEDDSAEVPEPVGAGEDESGPLICVLGPVELKYARGTVQSNRRTLALELTAWMAFHPGATNHQLDEVIAPAGRVTRDTRNTRLRDVRKWLGSTPENTLHLPYVKDQPDKLYRLSGVRCDWTEFQRLVSESHRADEADARMLLRQALTLVRGRPFAGIPARRYAWSETLCQEMVSGIVDAADDLADRCMRQGDARGALWAVARGLNAAREMECLWRHRFRALSMLGQYEELEASVRELDALVLDLGTAVDEATEKTLRTVESARR
ncbi:BTAD domain-containing putative transcriptional regulator [Streptomyces sp. NPDC085659]|uniref:BTAD domain-containing putative transcriptional regulator n=1 Tax=Streptomyces sp. NPDC085659 TaxID=3155177 RepID=UPI00344C398A